MNYGPQAYGAQASRLHYGPQASCLLFVFLLFPVLLYADSTIAISILSILEPTELTITLRKPDRAILKTHGSQSAIAAHAPIRVKLQNDRLWISSGVSASSVSIDCMDGCLLELKLPGLIPRQYAGNLRLNAGPSTMNVVLLVDEDSLVASILASEMGEYRLHPALQAFAVVVRSFLRSSSRHPELGADFCDLTHCQVFQSYLPTSQAQDAVRNVSGLVLTYRQKPFRPYYFRSCGGTTATFEEVWKQKSPDYPFTSMKCACNNVWETALEASQLELLLGFPVNGLHQNEKGLVFSGDKRKRSYSLEDFRILAGRTLGWNRIRSNDFIAKQTGSFVIIQGKGIGHRVGFCQNGAFRMAQQHKSFQEILQYYFPNTEIRTVN